LKNLVLLLVALVLFTGCSVKTPDADFTKFDKSKGVKYPEINVLLTSEPLQYYMYRDVVMTALNESNMFTGVTVQNPYTPFSLEVNLNSMNKDEANAVGIGKAVLSGSSLGLIPMDLEFQTRGYAKLRYKGVIIDSFNVDSNFKTSFSIYKMGSKDIGVMGAYRKAVEEILEKIEKRDSFKKQLLEEKKEDKLDV